MKWYEEAAKPSRRFGPLFMPAVSIGLIGGCHMLLMYTLTLTPMFQNSTKLDVLVALLLCPMVIFSTAIPHASGITVAILNSINSLIWGAGIYVIAVWAIGLTRR